MRCPTCPIAAGSPCPGESQPSLCRLAATGEPRWVRHLAGLAVAAASPRPATPTRQAVAVAEPPMSDDEIAAMARCPSRVAEPCGCAWPFRCLAAYGATVRHADCRRCLRSRGSIQPGNARPEREDTGGEADRRVIGATPGHAVEPGDVGPPSLQTIEAGSTRLLPQRDPQTRPHK